MPANNQAYVEGSVGGVREKGQTNRAETDSPNIPKMLEAIKRSLPLSLEPTIVASYRTISEYSLTVRNNHT